MEKHELLLQEEQKAPLEAGKSTLGNSRLAIAAAIISALAAIQGCEKNEEFPNRADSGTKKFTGSSETAEISTIPLTLESNKMTYAQADEARKKHCVSRHGDDQVSGGKYPFVLIKGSQIDVIDACDLSRAHPVSYSMVKDGNFTDLYIPTPFGRERKNCYVIKDTSNTTGLNAKRVNYETYTDVTRNLQFAYINQYGTQTIVDGDKIELVTAPIVKCPDNLPISTENAKPATGGSQIKTIVTDPSIARYAAGAKEDADRAKAEADRAKAEADRSANNTAMYARDLEEYRKTVLRNNAINIIIPSPNATGDAGVR
jgi:hypothetical protein